MQNHLQKGQYVEKRFRASNDDIEVKEDEDGRKRVRMPISSTAEDRDGDEFSRDGLENERDQINEGKVPAFLDHGRGSRGGYYGALGIVGTWDEASIETESHDGESVDVLYADFVPTNANEDAEDIVALLEDDMPVGASVGFRIIDYERDRDEGKFIFHSVDLLETSIVGIPSNPLTVNDGADAIGAKALGSPTVPTGIQRHGYGSQPQAVAPPQAATHQHQPQAPVPADFSRMMGSDPSDLEASLADVERRLDDLEGALGGGTSTTPPAGDSSADSPDETNDMSDPDDGGDDPANDDLAELRDSVERQAETNEMLANSIDSLVETFDEERDTEPDETDDADEPDDGKDAGTDDDTVQLFLGEDADEDVRKEFEALREKANDDGELELADSETKLFGSEDDSSETTDDDSSGVTI
ncbi:peptidase U35 phage prohead HK97 [Natrialba chahannaoensis JCM 10990]|uniref:Peptidase U35 phage prohead HK97 n=1 Tax=Natrialba chahannaoensis JCM 10990 TaxID=1227492 RepID=M0AEC6_9EURY|nr:peptidase U35 [Natrialba chahannaoensis]ELY96756.1 peptidase U35 phage prohead HK97 [Natrialba chahannaoensis JCM 10990]